MESTYWIRNWRSKFYEVVSLAQNGGHLRIGRFARIQYDHVHEDGSKHLTQVTISWSGWSKKVSFSVKCLDCGAVLTEGDHIEVRHRGSQIGHRRPATFPEAVQEP